MTERQQLEFWSAGTADWWPGWVVLAVMAGWIVTTSWRTYRVP